MREEKIIGIDPGTKATGWGVIEIKNNRYISLGYGTIYPPETLSLEKRYEYIFDQLCSILTSYSPHALSVETQFVNKNIMTTLKLGMARGMAYLAAAKHNIPLYEYAPAKAKKAVSGHGSAKKEKVQHMIKMLLGLDEIPSSLDAADALSLAITHAHFCRSPLCTNRFMAH